jgi:tripartite-type tricarboxylate transporter receptor subunit TctC
MGTNKNLGSIFILTALAMALLLATSASASDMEFYKGKTITYVIATKPGGGYDSYARLIGKYLPKYIPGVIINTKNSPGAGHILGANEVYLAPSDGLTIGTFNTGLIYSQIVGVTGIKFDLAKYSWIGKAASDPRFLVVSAKSPYKTFKEFAESKEQIKMAGAGAGSASDNETLLLAAATGANLKTVTGFSGREAEMAMMRGEVTGQIRSYSGLSRFIKSKEGRVLLQIGGTKAKDLQDVPLFTEIKLSPQGKKLLSIIAGTAEISRLTAAPPNVPAARLQVLRDAYKKTLTDPEFLKEAEKASMEIDPGFGDQVAKEIREAIHQPPENMALLKKIINVNAE